ncbi:MAG: hypothetical protein LBS16_00330 [Prevotellaceae bacterium]|jgi:hypothetical protein|nr:hypothetical protein [Prevotellaceae bacterium]
MKRIAKVAAITLAALVGAALVVCGVLVWVVFTPERLTPLANRALNEQLKCHAAVEKVELTFFSSFPQFGLRIEQVVLVNPVEEAPSDTLLKVGVCTVALDAMELLKNNRLTVTDITFNNGVANLFINAEGHANFDILPSDTLDTDTTAFQLPFTVVDLQSLAVTDVDVRYIDLQTHLSAHVDGVAATLAGNWTNTNNGNVSGALNLDALRIAMSDSTEICAQTDAMSLAIEGAKTDSSLTGTLAVVVSTATCIIDTTHLLSRTDVALNMPFSWLINDNRIALDAAKVVLADQSLTVNGWAEWRDNNDLAMDIRFVSDEWQLEKVLALIPADYTESLKGLTVDAKLAVNGLAEGVYNDVSMPLITANIAVKHGAMQYDDLPYRFFDIFGRLSATVDLNKQAHSRLDIHSLHLKADRSQITVGGTIEDLLNTMRLNLHLAGDIYLPDAAPLLPSDMKLVLAGHAAPDLTLQGALDDITDMRLKKITASGNIRLNDFEMLYDDSIALKTPSATVALTVPVASQNLLFEEVVQARIAAKSLDVKLYESIIARTEETTLLATLSDVMDDKLPLALACSFDAGKLYLQADSIEAQITDLSGDVAMTPSGAEMEKTFYRLNIASSDMVATMGDALQVDARSLALNGQAIYDEKQTQTQPLLQWRPNIHLTLASAAVKMDALTAPALISNIDGTLTHEKLSINNTRILLDGSDFTLSGVVTNIDKYLENTGLLVADFDFVSDNTDVNRLMALFNGFGATDSVQQAALAEPAESGGEPFMVPWNVDVTLRTRIKNALAGKTAIQNVGGTLIVKDGVLVLEQMGFTCDAAKMQLTAIYRSQRKNHLFAGVDFHLLDIEIEKLITMIPDIDTIVPMLKNFTGKAEFHLAAETYLKSNYDIKWSTLRGAAAIEGKNLVLLDNATFAQIAKLLLFNRKTENVVDSLSVEMTVFRNEVELYPFLLTMDKYQAIVGGRYDLGQNYDAHVEAVIPLRLAVDVKGNPASDFKIKLTKTKYSNLFKPDRQNAVQQRTLSLKKIISDALKANVKEQ